MRNMTDSDTYVGNESDAAKTLDEAPYTFLTQKKLTKEESMAPGVVQMLIAQNTELRREKVSMLDIVDKYNDLRVCNANLMAFVSAITTMDVFLDLVLVLAPLFLGITFNISDFGTIKMYLVWIPLILFVVAALIAKRCIRVNSEKCKTEGRK